LGSFGIPQLRKETGISTILFISNRKGRDQRDLKLIMENQKTPVILLNVKISTD
jgi:hypothetical protein